MINLVGIFKRKDIFFSLFVDKIYFNLLGDCKKKNYSFVCECIWFLMWKRLGFYVFFWINYILKLNGFIIFCYYMIGLGVIEFGCMLFKFCKWIVKKVDVKYFFMIFLLYFWKFIFFLKIFGLIWLWVILKLLYKFECCKENFSIDYVFRLY